MFFGFVIKVMWSCGRLLWRVFLRRWRVLFGNDRCVLSGRRSVALFDVALEFGKAQFCVDRLVPVSCRHNVRFLDTRSGAVFYGNHRRRRLTSDGEHNEQNDEREQRQGAAVTPRSRNTRNVLSSITTLRRPNFLFAATTTGRGLRSLRIARWVLIHAVFSPIDIISRK